MKVTTTATVSAAYGECHTIQKNSEFREFREFEELFFLDGYKNFREFSEPFIASSLNSLNSLNSLFMPSYYLLSREQRKTFIYIVDYVLQNKI